MEVKKKIEKKNVPICTEKRIPALCASVRRSVGPSVRQSVGPSVHRSKIFLNCERFSHYCSRLTVRDWIAVYPALFMVYTQAICLWWLETRRSYFENLPRRTIFPHQVSDMLTNFSRVCEIESPFDSPPPVPFSLALCDKICNFLLHRGLKQFILSLKNVVQIMSYVLVPFDLLTSTK